MDRFQQYLESLPRPNNPKDRDFLETVMHPYIVKDTIAEKIQPVCPECVKPFPTRTLTVYVPSQDEYVEFNFHNVGSGNNVQICGLRETVLGDPYQSLESIANEIKIEAWKRLAFEGFWRLPPVLN